MTVKYMFLFPLLILITNNDACENGVDPADDPKNIERPCPDFDVDCIREYFLCNSECDTPLGSVPDPLLLDHYKLEIANSNMTGELNLVSVEGLNGDIVEFYTNSETQKLVIAMRVDSIKIQTPNVTVKYNRVKKEPIVRNDEVRFELGGIIFTAVFPSFCDLRLNEADVFSYIENPKPNYSIGPYIEDTSDPTAKNEVTKFYASMKEDLVEAFLFQGKLLMVNYIQYVIGDFGLDGSNPCDCTC